MNCDIEIEFLELFLMNISKYHVKKKLTYLGKLFFSNRIKQFAQERV